VTQPVRSEAWERIVAGLRAEIAGLPPIHRAGFALAVAEAADGHFLRKADANALATLLAEAARYARATAPAAVPRWVPIAEAYARRLQALAQKGKPNAAPPPTP